MGRTLGFFMNWKGPEEAVKRFLLNLAYDEDVIDMDDFESIEEIYKHVYSKVQDGDWSYDFTSALPGVWDMGLVDFDKDSLYIEAEENSHYEMLMELCDVPGIVLNNPGVIVEIYCDAKYYCGMEFFRYVNGELVEQWFENDRKDTGVWIPCIITWQKNEKEKTQNAVKSLLKEIITENEDCAETSLQNAGFLTEKSSIGAANG